MVTVTRSARGLERAMTGKKYADQYDHTHLLMAGYKELVHDEVEHRPPQEILAELRAIEQEILQGIEELEGVLR